MKKTLSTLTLMCALFAPAFAQSEPTSEPASAPDVNVEVQAPAAAPAPAPAPNFNVDVSAPAPSTVESKTSETKIIDRTTTAAPASDNTGLLVIGGVVGVLALGAIIIASNSRAR